MYITMPALGINKYSVNNKAYLREGLKKLNFKVQSLRKKNSFDDNGGRVVALHK